MSLSNPEYATFRDLVEVVDRVDTKLDEHRIDTEKRLSRIEKALFLVGLLAFAHPHVSLKSLPLLEGAVTGLAHIL